MTTRWQSQTCGADHRGAFRELVGGRPLPPAGHLFEPSAEPLPGSVAFTMTAREHDSGGEERSASRDGFRLFCASTILSPGSWKELLDFAERLPAPPPVIVTSRLADERMWAEVLNLGGYDVLARPFNSEEVIRTVTSAWSLWQHRFQCRAESSQRAGGNAA